MSDQEALPGGDFIKAAVEEMVQEDRPYAREFADFLLGSFSDQGSGAGFDAALAADPGPHDDIVGRVAARALTNAIAAGADGWAVIELAVAMIQYMSRWQLYLVGTPEGHPRFELRSP